MNFFRSFSPTVFVGDHLSSLYALPALVDETTVTIMVCVELLNIYDLSLTSSLSQNLFFFQSKYEGPPLLEGPHPIRSPKQPAASTHPHFSVDVRPTENEEILLQGYHEVPENLKLELIFQDRYTALLIPIPLQQFQPVDSSHFHTASGSTSNQTFNQTASYWKLPPYITVTIWVVLLSSLVILIFLHFSSPNGLFSRNFHRSFSLRSTHSKSSSPSYASDTNELFSVGKISFDPSAIIGRGCEGTVVYK